MSCFPTIHNSNKVVKPFCKVCYDSGKSENEYNSHFVKSEPGAKGVVVCPTLLSHTCTYCKKTGHTLKYCDAANTKKINNNISQQDNKLDHIKNKRKRNNREVKDREVKDRDMNKEEFPALTEPVSRKRTFEQSYVSVAATLPVVNKTPPKIVKMQDTKQQPIKSTLDEYGSDSDYEYEYEYEYDDYSEEEPEYKYEDEDEEDYDDEDLAHILDSVTCSKWRNYSRVNPFMV